MIDPLKITGFTDLYPDTRPTGLNNGVAQTRASLDSPVKIGEKMLSMGDNVSFQKSVDNLYSEYKKPAPYDVIRPDDALRLPGGIGKKMLESGAVVTFRPDSDAVVVQRKHQNDDALLYDIVGRGATLDTSQVHSGFMPGNREIGKIDVVIDGDKNRVISPYETYVKMKGKGNIIGSGSGDENIHIVDDNNIFAGIGAEDYGSREENMTNSINFGSLTRPAQKNS